MCYFSTKTLTRSAKFESLIFPEETQKKDNSILKTPIEASSYLCFHSSFQKEVDDLWHAKKMALSKYESTRETTNLARVARIILGPCTDILLDILWKQISPSALSHNVKTFIAKTPKRKQCPINPQQAQLVFSGNYSDFDITLLYVLLRNMCLIPPHANQWGHDPSPGDRSVSANIERIRILRNEYYGHVTQISLSDTDFKKTWKNIFQIIKELEGYLSNGTKYRDDLLELKICTMQNDIIQREGNILLNNDDTNFLKFQNHRLQLEFKMFLSTHRKWLCKQMFTNDKLFSHNKELCTEINDFLYSTALKIKNSENVEVKKKSNRNCVLDIFLVNYITIVPVLDFIRTLYIYVC